MCPVDTLSGLWSYGLLALWNPHRQVNEMTEDALTWYYCLMTPITICHMTETLNILKLLTTVLTTLHRQPIKETSNYGIDNANSQRLRLTGHEPVTCIKSGPLGPRRRLLNWIIRLSFFIRYLTIWYLRQNRHVDSISSEIPAELRWSPVEIIFFQISSFKLGGRKTTLKRK